MEQIIHNRLAGEKSPYLLQHADNPVDWYPWSEEAFERAKKENKPIFLSIGYSSCHWCHVMEHESFENGAIAALMNKHFVCVKVDREERPDIDEIYMTAVQMLTGRGGWPLSVFLTPDLKPFYGGTYYPPEDRYGMPGFPRILQEMARLWEEENDKVLKAAKEMDRGLAAQLDVGREDAAPVTTEVIERALNELEQTFDPVWGGFGGAPKFPQTSALDLLLRRYAVSHNDGYLRMVRLTLDKMAEGGMYDHVGGGFHRYSTDARWLVPHFEKMLYDNALLGRLYIDGYLATNNPGYLRVARETLEYALREMTSPQGGFYSAQDADTEEGEGDFYVWTPEQIVQALGKEDGALFNECYGVTAKGNFEGKNILHLKDGLFACAQRIGIPPEELNATLAAMREILRQKRMKRPQPFKDEKVIVAWNALMISAFARGYDVTGDKRYLAAAANAATFILETMSDEERLMHSFLGESTNVPAFLDDYAVFIEALIDLYQATFDIRWLDRADRFARTMIQEFKDATHGGFFTVSHRHRDVPMRAKPYYDGATASGNSAAALALLRLSRFLGNERYVETARETIESNRSAVNAAPRGYINMLIALDVLHTASTEIAIVGNLADSHVQKLLTVVNCSYIPNKTIALVNPHDREALQMAERMPLLRDKQMVEGKAAAYVCENFTCRKPVSDAAELAALLETPAL